MKAEVEIYKGIEFVRLSALAKEDARAVLQSPFRNRMIKIMRGTEILSDCLPWSAYLEWYDQKVSLPEVSVVKAAATPLPVKFKLVID